MVDGYIRVAAVSPHIKIADVDYNTDIIIDKMRELDALSVEIAVFPELCITGYTCGDLFHNQTLIDAAKNALDRILFESRSLNLHAIVGLPMVLEQTLYNCAVVVQNGHATIVAKTYLPNYNEFYEHRWFRPSTHKPIVIDSHGVKIGVEICEDLWAPLPPSTTLSLQGAEVIFNLSASNDLVGKHDYLCNLISQQSARCICGYVYASAGLGESSTDLAFLPKAIIAECGKILEQNNRFDFSQTATEIADIDIIAIRHDRMHNITYGECVARTQATPYTDDNQAVALVVNDASCTKAEADLLYRKVNKHPFVPAEPEMAQRCNEIFTIQQAALAQRIQSIGSPKIVVGISGGLDSTLALLVAHSTMQKLEQPASNIIAVTMPGFGTTGRTYHNAMMLMQLLGVTIREISIVPAVQQHFADISHDPSVKDATYENSQARERTQILMDISNQVGGIVLGTGDLSELALGWATYNGDHMSMYGINAGIPKTLISYLVRYFAESSTDEELRCVLTDIIDTPISPELTPADENGEIAQKTEDLVGPYELHDFFLYYTLRYGFTPRRIYNLARKAFAWSYTDETIKKWLITFYKRFFAQQFKRSCLPDGPKVGSVSLSPRGDWRMPSDAAASLWISEAQSL